jgi:hypothetical protein
MYTARSEAPRSDTTKLPTAAETQFGDAARSALAVAAPGVRRRRRRRHELLSQKGIVSLPKIACTVRVAMRIHWRGEVDQE